jgi:hypothetical protein
LQYAPLIFYLCVAHISVAHYAQYAPLKGQICVAHIENAPLISQDILSTTLLVGPTDLLVAHFAQNAPLVKKISVKHI